MAFCLYYQRKERYDQCRTSALSSFGLVRLWVWTSYTVVYVIRVAETNRKVTLRELEEMLLRRVAEEELKGLKSLFIQALTSSRKIGLPPP